MWIVVIAAFSETGTLGGQTLLPESHHDQAVRRRSSTEYPYWRWFFNSLVISVVAAAGTVLLASRPPTPSPACGSGAAGRGCSRCC